MTDSLDFTVPVTTHLEKPIYFRVARAAKELGVGEGVIVAELVRRGLAGGGRAKRRRSDAGKPRRAWGPADDAALRAGHAARSTLTAVADQTGWAISTLSRRATMLGLEAHFRGRPPKVRAE